MTIRPRRTPLRPSALKPGGIEIKERTTVRQGYGILALLDYRHRRFDGSWSPNLTREIYDPGDSVIVLPVDTVRDEVLLIEQLRPGPVWRNEMPLMLECVAGRIDAGETPAEAAIRETREESGLELSDPVVFTQVYASPGTLAERFVFVTGSADLSHAGGLHGSDDENEDIRALIAPLEAIPEAVASGAIANAPTLIALQWLLLNRTRRPAPPGTPETGEL